MDSRRTLEHRLKSSNWDPSREEGWSAAKVADARSRKARLFSFEGDDERYAPSDREEQARQVERDAGEQPQR